MKPAATRDLATISDNLPETLSAEPAGYGRLRYAASTWSRTIVFDIVAILPYAFFTSAILIGLALIIRRFWRLNSGLDEIEKADGTGKITPSVRHAWLVNRIVFVVGILVTVLLTILMLRGVDEILRR